MCWSRSVITVLSKKTVVGCFVLFVISFFLSKCNTALYSKSISWRAWWVITGLFFSYISAHLFPKWTSAIFGKRMASESVENVKPQRCTLTMETVALFLSCSINAGPAYSVFLLPSHIFVLFVYLLVWTEWFQLIWQTKGSILVFLKNERNGSNPSGNTPAGV